jgi:ethanolaminephosphotransferase
VNTWLYSTYDNVDGRQARRTHSSSPLGELFDHGVDSLTCSLGCITQIAVMSAGTSFRAIIMFILTTGLFFFTTWEHFHTGVLYLGIINGPTEGIIIVCATMLISAMVGPMFWSQPLTMYLPMSLHSYMEGVITIDFLIVTCLLLALTFGVPLR